MNLRRDFELWIFNIVETVMDYGVFGSWTKCILHYAMFRCGPHRLMFEQACGGQEWSVVVYIRLGLGVALSGGVALLRHSVYCLLPTHTFLWRSETSQTPP